MSPRSLCEKLGSRVVLRGGSGAFGRRGLLRGP
jgi:hypothetical protein